MLGAFGLQELGRAPPLVAEDEIVADHHGPGAETRDEHLGNEFLRRLLRESEIEMQREQQIDTEGFEHQRFGPKRRQAKSLPPGPSRVMPMPMAACTAASC